MNANKSALPTDWVGPNDAPELTNSIIVQADEYAGDKLLHRGRHNLENPTQSLTVRYDAEVVEAFKATCKVWQTRMNAALNDWLKTHSPTESGKHLFPNLHYARTVFKIQIFRQDDVGILELTPLTRGRGIPG